MVKSILFYDGHCALCNFFVNLVIRFEPKKSIYFAALQSSFAQDFLAKNKVDETLDSIVFYENGNCFVYQKAVFKILAHLSYPIKAFLIFKYLPNNISKAAYLFIAKNRFKLMKKLTYCPIPSNENKNRFIN